MSLEIFFPSKSMASINSSLNFLEPKFFFLAIILSLVAQAGDLTISYSNKVKNIEHVFSVSNEYLSSLNVSFKFSNFRI